MNIRFNFDLPPKKVNELITERVTDKPLKPHFIDINEVKVPEVYKRLQDGPAKDQFRKALVTGLKKAWSQLDGMDESKLEHHFLALANELDDQGALVFGDLIQKSQFQLLIEKYQTLLSTAGSKSWIHSYVNLGNQPEFLNDPAFKGAFLHPLLIALIAYRVGGPIRIVDARGKDAEPISVMAQDNMLHVDNTPYNDEYKVIVTWERGKASGPKGQNFVFIPGAHKAVRDTQITEKKEAYSTENGSIFVRPETIDQVFEQQKKVLQCEHPCVVEVHHQTKPLTTVFAAGSLPHHRYRTEEGHSRSCMILAFHRIKDNPGQFIAKKYLESISKENDLNSFLFGNQQHRGEQVFIEALGASADEFAYKLECIRMEKEGVEIIKPSERVLKGKDFEKWMRTVTSAPTVEELKIKEKLLPLEGDISRTEVCKTLVNVMRFDKHGPLDLRLYSDSHEEIRKWARNRIREMKLERLEKHLSPWTEELKQPTQDHLFNPSVLNKIAEEIAEYITSLPESKKSEAKMDDGEKISPNDAYRSLKQLVIDLGESSLRCENRQAFLSTSLFLFWTCEELCSMDSRNREELQSFGNMLLSNYIATAILIEKQIQFNLHLKIAPVSLGIFSSDSIDDLTAVSPTARRKLS